MTRRLSLSLFSLLAVTRLLASPPFAQTASDLPADPAARFGRLPNGVAYVIRANHEPKGRASLRLLVNAGSLNEADDQRGLAHFLEHLAFNGSRHYAPGTLVEFFQHNGMSFGGDTNAYTTYDHTSYQLELPDTDAVTLEKALTLFADYGDGLLLESRSIEKERGIILSEKRARDSADYRVGIAEEEFVLAQTRIPARPPIGEPDVISHAQRERFRNFYDTWYRPENLTAIVVGDFDAAKVEAQVVRILGQIQAHGAAATPPSLGTIALDAATHVRFFAEPDASATKVSIQKIVPFVPPPDLAAYRLRMIPREAALAMLNRRLAIRAKQAGSPFTSGSASIDEGFRTYRATGVELTCEPAHWREVLGVAEQELRRVLRFGFDPAELKPVVAETKNALEQAARSADTRRSNELADALQTSIHDRRVFTSPSADLALFTPSLDRLTAEECTAAFRALWNETTGRYVWATGNLTLPNADFEIRAALDQSEKIEVTAPERISDSAFGYADFGRPGEVASQTHTGDLDVTQVRFTNGVRLNLKHTDFEANKVYVSVRVGGGLLSAPVSAPGLLLLANLAFTPGGLGKHSADELQRILAGHTLGLEFQVAGDAFVLTGSTTHEDLLLQLQLLAAELTDPGFRPEALRQAHNAITQTYTSLDHTVEGPFEREVPALLASGDARFGLPTQETAEKRTLTELKDWLTPQFAHGPIEIAIVGDLDIPAAIKAVAQTMGALPRREGKPAYAAERRVLMPGQGIEKSFAVDTPIPKGLIGLYWPATDAFDVARTRRLHLLALIFSDRLRVKIREELGSSYSPQFGFEPSDTFQDFGFFATQMVVEPNQAARVAAAVRAIAADLVANGVTTDELDRARRPLLSGLKASARTNAYWLFNVLAKAQEKPEFLDWCRTRLADNEAITTAELNAYAKNYFRATRLCEFRSLPQSDAHEIDQTKAAAPVESGP